MKIRIFESAKDDVIIYAVLDLRMNPPYIEQRLSKS